MHFSGHYVPQLSEAILDHNSKNISKKEHINLKGFMVSFSSSSSSILYIPLIIRMYLSEVIFLFCHFYNSLLHCLFV